MKSILIFALIVASCTATISPRGVNISQDGLWEDIVAKINEVVQIVIDAVNALWQRAQEELGQLVETIVKMGEDIINNIQQAVNAQIEQLLKMIEDLINNVEEVTAAVEQCAKTAADDIMELPDEAINGTIECVYEQVDQAKAIYDNAMTLVNTIVEEVESLPGKITSCRDIACLYKVLEEAEKMLVTVPGQVSEIIKTAIDLLLNMPQNLINCETDNINKLWTKGNTIVEEAKRCIDDAVSS